jgi:hypothetical protein
VLAHVRPDTRREVVVDRAHEDHLDAVPLHDRVRDRMRPSVFDTAGDGLSVQLT